MREWNWRGIRAVIGKDLKQVRQNRMVWLPMIILPVILQIILPTAMILLPSFVGSAMNQEDLGPLLQALPPSLGSLRGETPEVQWVILSSAYLFAPLFLIVPLMVSSILGADSFVGEKERKTLEGLLYTPLSDTEIFVAKVLTALVPALVISIGSFAVYTLVVNAAGYPTVGRIFFPTLFWWPLVFWLGPAVSVTALGATVLISSRAKTFMQAQQTSGVLVLPVVAWMIAQSAGLFFMGVGLMLLVGLVVWLVGLWLVWVGARTFSRGRLIAGI